MSMQSLERTILAEAKIITGNKKLRMKDIVEWSSSEVKAQDGEKLYRLPELGVNIAVKTKSKPPRREHKSNETNNNP